MSHRIFSVTVDSIKGCELAQVVAGDRPLTIIGGDNAQGKSSFLDAVAMTLGGKKLFPKNPIYGDRDEAQVSVHLSGESSHLPWPCTVTRTLTRLEDGEVTTKVKIEADDGSVAPSPQRILNDVLGVGLTFDPLAFTREKPSVQVDIVKGLVGLDFSELDEQYERAYQERTHVNRVIKQMDGKIKQTPLHSDVPVEKISVRDLMDQLREIQGHNQEVASQREQIRRQEAQIAQHKVDITSRLRRIDELQKEINALSATIGECENTIEAIENNPIEPRDPEPIQQQIEQADAINRKIDENDERLDLLTEKKTQEQKSKQLTKQLKQIDAQKAEMSAQANWPIKGLGFGPDGLELNGIPYSDLSSREQLNCSVAIALKLNPVFPFCMIRDGSLLDDSGLVELEAIATNHNGQVFLERVSKDSRCHVVFQDGKLAKRSTSTGDQK
jgi:hypothetical protein